MNTNSIVWLRRLIEGCHDVRHFALFGEELDSGCDNECAPSLGLFFLHAVEVKRLWLGIVGVVQLPLTIHRHLPLASIQISNANRIQTHESDRARLRDYYTIMKGFL